MKRTLFITALCLGALLLATCGGSSDERSAARAVPSDSIAVVTVNWRAVARDAELKRLIKGAEVEALLGRLKVGGDEVSELAVFSDGREAPAGSGGMVIRGSFDGREVAERLKGGGWSEQRLGENRLYTNPADGSCLVALTKNLLALGTRAGVEGAVRALRDPEERFVSNPLYKRLSRRAEGERYPLTLFVAFPQAAQDAAATVLELSSVVMDFAGVGPLGELLNKFGYVRAFGCSISRKGDALPVKLLAVMKDEESAQLVSGVITLSKGLTSFAPKHNLSPSDAEALKSLESLSVTREKDVLSVKVTMPVESLKGGY